MTTHSMRAILISLSLLAVLIAGCGSQTGNRIPAPTVANMQDAVAQILKKEPSQIDVTKSLYALGANEADIVNLVMAVEATFEVELPSSEIGNTLGEIGQSLTVQKLADVASRHPKAK